jgi:hypothetical protein
MVKNNSMMNNINAVGGPMMQSCANSVLSSCPVASSIAPGSGPVKTPGIDSPCMMPGSPTNPMMGHHSPGNPAMMPGGAHDIAGSPIMNPNSQPTLTGDETHRIALLTIKPMRCTSLSNLFLE